jgi:hypothetical protein
MDAIQFACTIDFIDLNVDLCRVDVGADHDQLRGCDDDPFMVRVELWVGLLLRNRARLDFCVCAYNHNDERCNEKHPSSSVNVTVWSSILYSTLVYLAVGFFGAFSFPCLNGNHCCGCYESRVSGLF